ncbi:hypothetical protein ACM614_00830 [Streptomyces sp. 12297]
MTFARESAHSIGTVVPGFSRLTVAGTSDSVSFTARTRPVSATGVTRGMPSVSSKIRNSPSVSAVAPRTSRLPSGAWATLEKCSKSLYGAASGVVTLRAYSGLGFSSAAFPGTP